MRVIAAKHITGEPNTIARESNITGDCVWSKPSASPLKEFSREVTLAAQAFAVRVVSAR